MNSPTVYWWTEDGMEEAVEGCGDYVKLEGDVAKDNIWLVYARSPHTLAHELAHILLQTWDMIGSDPHAGNGEPFCYMLSQLMLDAR